MRLIRAAVSLLALMVLLLGAPWALLTVGTALNVFDLSVLLRPDDGSLFFAVLTVAGWLAWAAFALSTLIEAAALVRRRPLRLRLPGLGWSRTLASGLLVASIGVLLPAGQHAQATPQDASPTRLASAGVQAGPAREAPSGTASTPTDASRHVARTTRAEGHRHVVRAGDNLWALAERYYGDGGQWRRIAAANSHLLSGGPDRLEVGWTLRIPGVAQARTVTVRSGDTLSGLAEEHLGDAARWTEIHRINRDLVRDPDVLEVGWRLALPNVEDAAPADGDVRDRRTARGDTGDEVRRSRGEVEAARAGHRAEAGRPEHQDDSVRGGVSTDADDAGSAAAPAPVPDTGGVGTDAEARASSESTPSSEISARAPRPPADSRSDAERKAGQSGVDDSADLAWLLALGGLGVMAAAVLPRRLRARRDVQLRLRPLGRRLRPAPGQAVALETATAQAASSGALILLGKTRRALHVHAVETGTPLPALRHAWLGEESFVLDFDEPPTPPVGFSAEGCTLRILGRNCAYLPVFGEEDSTFPAMVTLGRSEDGRVLLVDLEAIGVLGVSGPSSADAVEALALELSGVESDAVAVTRVDDPEGLAAALVRLEAESRAREDALADLGLTSAAAARLDADVAPDWQAKVLIVAFPPGAASTARLADLCRPELGLAAVAVTEDVSTRWSVDAEGLGRLEPAGVSVRAQRLAEHTVQSIADLSDATSLLADGSVPTDPAPWWSDSTDDPAVTPLRPRPVEGTIKESVLVHHEPEDFAAGVLHPTLRLIGPIDLLGTRGTPPPRAHMACMEYCAWLVEHPGLTAGAMASALFVAESTRRSNMSRLRTWLGSDELGQAYLPDAYSGRIFLNSAVSSDWRRLQIMTAPGINLLSVESLMTALDLVRGAPLEDAAPGQWRWAEELRTDIVSTVRDIGVVLARTALERGDVDLARWAAARALAAAPDDELLLCERISTELRAGNRREVERLALRITASARDLGIDLADETVRLLQRAMQTGARARA